MYRRNPFAPETPQWCPAFATSHGFPTVIVTGPDGPLVVHAAAVVDPDGAFVDVHFARRNPATAIADGAQATLVFLGDHTYVSPRWYADRATNVPTWDYEAVHATGRLEAMGDEATLDHLRELTAVNEPEDGWDVEEAIDHVRRQQRGMAAFRLHVTSWEGQRKLSQNHDVPDRRGVAAALMNSDRDGDRRLGQQILATTQPDDSSARSAARSAATGPSIHLADFTLREPTLDDGPAIIEAGLRSAELHGPYGGTPNDEETYATWHARSQGDDTHRLLAFHRGDLIGVVGLQQIVRGPGQYTVLGYTGFEPHAGRGLMRRAVALGLDVAFGELGLHRAEAGIQPSNTRSIALVRALGFQYEGLLRGLLFLDDQWRDHELWSLLADEWPGAAALFD